MGNFIAILIFLASCVSFLILIHKKYNKWALLVVIHIIGLFFIDRITLNNGGKRYLDSKQETWEFQYDETKYLIERNKEYESLTIYIESQEYPNYESFDPLISGNCKKLKNGWELSNDTMDIKILGKKLIGFPAKTDTLEIEKIYF